MTPEDFTAFEDLVPSTMRKDTDDLWMFEWSYPCGHLNVYEEDDGQMAVFRSWWEDDHIVSEHFGQMSVARALLLTMVWKGDSHFKLDDQGEPTTDPEGL